MWFCPNGGARAQVPLTGSGFIDAFIGPMRNLHRIEGQPCQMDRLVDRMRQIAHQRRGHCGQAADQRRAMRHLEQQGGQDVAVGCGVKGDVATVLQHDQHPENPGH